MQSKEDLRIKKTKKNLYQGLIELLEQKPFEEIKTKEICEISLINRSTFYDHFSNKYDLLQSLLNEKKDEYEKKIKEKKKDYSHAKEYYMTIIDILFSHLEENKYIYKAILQNNNNSIVIDIINNSVIKYVSEIISKYNNQNIPNEIISTFYTSAITNICLMYLKYPTKYKKDDIIKYLDRLLPEEI